MSDVAILAAGFDGRELEKGAATLEKVSAAAAKADAATEKVGKTAARSAVDWRSLGFQVNDVATSLASGSSPFQVMAQQGGQVYQALSTGPGGVAGGLKSVGTYLTGLVTPARLALGGLTAVGGAGLIAYNEWHEAEERVTLALMGIGRASGATVDQVNGIARASASAGKVSVASATEIATAMISVGKVSADNFGSIIGVTRDFAKVMGVDTAEAAQVLAKALANPVKGAEQLNERLGFLDYRTQQLITSLVAQNRVTEAQQVIIKGVGDATRGASDNASFLSKAWNVVSTAVSNAGTAVGQALDEATGGGTREQQLKAITDRLSQLKALAARRSDAVNMGLGTTQDIARLTAEFERLRTEIDGVGQTAEQARLRMQSMTAGPVVNSFLPEVTAKRAAANASRLTEEVSNSPAMQAAIGVSQGEANLSRDRSREMERSLQTQIERTIALSDIQLKGVTARSPAEKASIAYQQTMIALGGQAISMEEKRAAASKVAAVVAAQGNEQLSEAAKDRIRSSELAVGAMSVEIQTIGKSAGETALLRANWQTYATLRQEADRNHTAFDQAQYDRLTKINAELSKQVQLASEARLKNDIGFDRAQIGRTDTEQRVQSTLRGAGVDAESEQGRFLASQIRINEQLRESKETTMDFAQTLVSGMRNGQSAAEALGNALNRIVDKLINKSLDMALSPLFGGGGGGGGILGSLFGGGGGGVAAGVGNIGGTGGLLGGLFASGGYTGAGGKHEPAGIVHRGEYVVNADATSRFRGLLESINSGMAGYASGGFVDPSPVPSPPSAMPRSKMFSLSGAVKA